MYITRRSHVIVFFCFALSVMLCLCCKAKEEKKEVDEKVSGQMTKFPPEDYQKLLNGIWNVTGMPIQDGVEEMFSWGESLVNHDCVSIDFAGEKPSVSAEGEELFVKDVSLSEINRNEVIMTLAADDGKVRGKLSIKIRGERAILFTDLGKSFIWGMDYDRSYYKVGGPGMDGKE